MNVRLTDYLRKRSKINAVRTSVSIPKETMDRLDVWWKGVCGREGVQVSMSRSRVITAALEFYLSHQENGIGDDDKE